MKFSPACTSGHHVLDPVFGPGQDDERDGRDDGEDDEGDDH